MKKNMGLFLIIVVGYIFCFYLGKNLIGSDFPVYYCAAKTLAYSENIKNLYNSDLLSECLTPEHFEENSIRQLKYIYSLPAACFFLPLILLPYFHAKALLMTLTVFSYCTAVSYFQKNMELTSNPVKKYIIPMFALWIPLHDEIRLSQINSILLIILIYAIHFHRKKPVISGLLFGCAAAFKIFPLIVPFFLGIKTPKTLLASGLFFLGVVLYSGAFDWLNAINNSEINNINKVVLMPFYDGSGFAGKLGYILVIGIISLSVSIYMRNDANFNAAYSISTLFVLLPIVEYHHLVFMIYPILYMLSLLKLTDKIELAVIFLIYGFIQAAYFLNKIFEPLYYNNLIYAASLLLWILFLKFFIKQLSDGGISKAKQHIIQ